MYQKNGSRAFFKLIKILIFLILKIYWLLILVFSKIIYPSSASLLIDGLHIDCCRAPEQFNSLLPQFQKEKVLSLGIVYGRNIWHNDLHRSLIFLEKAQISLDNRLWVAPSCSLLHCMSPLI
ncbi:hypothetical protein [Candidatus Coxiella mudrowiae]|uniref:hypothetical protein n=1 Tax=Candidatus Coxiella mudrowiae TaxID=2054173 RepID=UPI0027D32F38|nr:hypothetical protein [Candidatus Coxiella mudrowiae]